MAVRDKQSVQPDGKRLMTLVDGVKMFESLVHFDDRGSTCEIHNVGWQFALEDPISHVYYVTIRPGYAKGWIYHSTYSDRSMVIKGESKIVLFDDRDGSPTKGVINEHFVSDRKPTLISIPPFVWHAIQNIGAEDLLFVNMPTKPYDYENPDKFRLPLDTKAIPYDFKGAKGW